MSVLWQFEPRAVRAWPVEHCNIANARDEDCAGLFDERVDGGIALATVRCGHLELDEFVMGKGSVEFSNKRWRNTSVAEARNRPEQVRESTQMLLLLFGKWLLNSWHRPRVYR